MGARRSAAVVGVASLLGCGPASISAGSETSGENPTQSEESGSEDSESGNDGWLDFAVVNLLVLAEGVWTLRRCAGECRA